MSAMFRSLAHRNYRIWFIGALVSNVGAWMQATAQNWVVLTELTDNDAFAVGITMALQFAPQVLLVPFTGLIADRFERRKILMVTQSALMLLGLGLGLLLILGHAELWHLYVFALALGIVNAVDMPARQTFVSDLVSSSNMSNAVALNSASFNSAAPHRPGRRRRAHRARRLGLGVRHQRRHVRRGARRARHARAAGG